MTKAKSTDGIHEVTATFREDGTLDSAFSITHGRAVMRLTALQAATVLLRTAGYAELAVACELTAASA